MTDRFCEAQKPWLTAHNHVKISHRTRNICINVYTMLPPCPEIAQSKVNEVP